MDEVKVREWLDKLAEAKKVINENEFLNPERNYDEANICNVEYIQLCSGGHVRRIASQLGIEIMTEPLSGNCNIEQSFFYKGIKFLALERLVSEDAGTDRE